MISAQHPLFPAFLRLATQLSPENLSCDGECHPEEVQHRYNALRQDWSTLEQQFGAPVAEKDLVIAEENHRAETSSRYQYHPLA